VIAFLEGELGVRSIASRTPAASDQARYRRRGPSPGEGGDDYAIAQKRKSVTLVHRATSEVTPRERPDWGYEVARRDYGAVELDGGPWLKLPAAIVIKDVSPMPSCSQICYARPNTT